MTKYRTISDGYTNFLQYEKKYKVLWFKKVKWEYVFRPYYDKIWGRGLDVAGHKCFVCEYNTHIKEFVSKWPNIDKYFKWAIKQQHKLEKEALEYKQEINSKKNIINYL